MYMFMKRRILILSNTIQPQSQSNATKIHPGHKNKEICIKKPSERYKPHTEEFSVSCARQEATRSYGSQRTAAGRVQQRP